jgi:hypothetical protein
MPEVHKITFKDIVFVRLSFRPGSQYYVYLGLISTYQTTKDDTPLNHERWYSAYQSG